MKWKRIEGCEAVKSIQQECSTNQMISDDMYKPEIKTEKENLDDRFPFDTTADELEKKWKVNVWPTQLRTLIGLTITLNHGIPPGIGNFLKLDVQTMFSAQKK